MRWTVRQGPAQGGALTAAPSSPSGPPATPPAGSPATAPAVEATAAALVGLDAAGEVLEVPPCVRDVKDLALHLQVPIAAVATTSVLRTRAGRRLLVVASAAHTPFLPSLAAVLCEPELFRDDDTDVLHRTGSVLGSASPVGLAEPLPTYVDVALAPHPAIWVPAGHPHAVFRTRYDELLRLTSGHPVEIG